MLGVRNTNVGSECKAEGPPFAPIPIPFPRLALELGSAVGLGRGRAEESIEIASALQVIATQSGVSCPTVAVFAVLLSNCVSTAWKADASVQLYEKMQGYKNPAYGQST